MRDGGAALLVSSRHAARLLFLCAALTGALASDTVEAGKVTSAWSPPQAVISDPPPVVFGARFTPTGRGNVAEEGDTMAAVSDRVAAVGDIVAVGGDAVAEGGDNVAVGGDNVAAGDENVAAAAKGEIPPGVDNVAVGGDNLPRRGDNGAPATSEIATGALRKEGTKKQAPRHRKNEGKGSSEEDGTAARVAIMIACAVGAVLICCAWCWLNAMLIIIAWCIEKYRKRRELQLGAAKVDDGGEDGKVVHATMCGTLASVVCTSDVTSSAAAEACSVSRVCSPQVDSTDEGQDGTWQEVFQSGGGGDDDGGGSGSGGSGSGGGGGGGGGCGGGGSGRGGDGGGGVGGVGGSGGCVDVGVGGVDVGIGVGVGGVGGGVGGSGGGGSGGDGGGGGGGRGARKNDTPATTSDRLRCSLTATVCEDQGGGDSGTGTPATTSARFRQPLIATVSPSRFRHPLAATVSPPPHTVNANSVLCFTGGDATIAADPTYEPSLHRGWGWGGSSWAEEKGSERDNAATVASRRPWLPNGDDRDACVSGPRARRGGFWFRFGSGGGGRCPPSPAAGGGSSVSSSPVRVPTSRRRSRGRIGSHGAAVCGGVSMDRGGGGGGGGRVGGGSSSRSSSIISTSASNSSFNSNANITSTSRNNSNNSISLGNNSSSRRSNNNNSNTSTNTSNSACNSNSTNTSTTNSTTNRPNPSPHSSNDILEKQGVSRREARVGAVLNGTSLNFNEQRLDTSGNDSALADGEIAAETGLDKTEKHEKCDAEERTGGKSCPPPGEEAPPSPVLPRARVLWRAFSEVDHDMIEDNHRRAAQRHFARFSLTPVFENPPMCSAPFER